jgi:glycosyltransferase involved in cell wall biosynthesis
MLVSHVGGLAEIVPDGKIGYDVEPDSKQIADALCKFFEKHKQEEFEKNVVEEKKKYAWTTFTAAIDSVLKK